MTSNTAYSSDGYSVVINSEDLLNRAQALSSQQAGGGDARRHLVDAVVPESAYGSIPGGSDAANRLRECVGKHIDAIAKAGVSVQDFAARVAAAGQLAEAAETDTVKVSQIPAPFLTTDGS